MIIKKNIDAIIKTMLAIFVFILIFTGVGVGQEVAGNNLDSSIRGNLSQVEKIALLMEEDKALSYAQAVAKSSAMDAILGQSSGLGSVRDNLSEAEKVNLEGEEG